MSNSIFLGYSRDGQTAVVYFTFGPTSHGAGGYYLLSKVKGRWEIIERFAWVSQLTRRRKGFAGSSSLSDRCFIGRGRRVCRLHEERRAARHVMDGRGARAANVAVIAARALRTSGHCPGALLGCCLDV